MADDETFDSRDLLNELGSSNIPLPRIERRLVASLGSSASREDEARSIERALGDYLESSLRHAEEHEEKARAATAEADLYQHMAEGFHNSAQRTKALLDRLAGNPDWPS
jgi:hypothetical protein